jgi:hypothetical protein
MVSNSTNIIKKNNYLSPQIIEHKEDQDLFGSSNSSHGVCQWIAKGQWISSGTPVSSTNKADNHDIAKYCWKWR